VRPETCDGLSDLEYQVYHVAAGKTHGVEELKEVPIVPVDKGVYGVDPVFLEILDEAHGEDLGDAPVLVVGVYADGVYPAYFVGHLEFPTADLAQDEPGHLLIDLRHE